MHGACASSHMVRWHRHVCSIYTKSRNQNVMCFGSKVQAPRPTACCKPFRTARRRRMCIAWRYCCSSESSSNGPSESWGFSSPALIHRVNSYIARVHGYSSKSPKLTVICNSKNKLNNNHFSDCSGRHKKWPNLAQNGARVIFSYIELHFYSRHCRHFGRHGF